MTEDSAPPPSYQAGPLLEDGSFELSNMKDSITVPPPVYTAEWSSALPPTAEQPDVPIAAPAAGTAGPELQQQTRRQRSDKPPAFAVFSILLICLFFSAGSYNALGNYMISRKHGKNDPDVLKYCSSHRDLKVYLPNAIACSVLGAAALLWALMKGMSRSWKAPKLSAWNFVTALLCIFMAFLPPKLLEMTCGHNA